MNDAPATSELPAAQEQGTAPKVESSDPLAGDKTKGLTARQLKRKGLDADGNKRQTARQRRSAELNSFKDRDVGPVEGYSDCSYVFTLPTGLEKVAQSEATEVLGSLGDNVRTELMDGRLFLSVQGDLTPSDPRVVGGIRKMRTVERGMGNIGVSAGIKTDSTDVAPFRAMASCFKKETWEKALAVFDAYRECAEGGSGEPGKGDKDRVVKFRVTAKKGKHSYDKTAVASAFADGLMQTMGGVWIPSLRDYDVEILLHLQLYLCHVSISLDSRSRMMAHNDENVDRQLSFTTLRPSVVHSMLRLARHCPIPGATIVDPMCGSGTLMEAAALAYPEASCISGDFADVAVEKARHNLAQLPSSARGRYTVVKWDATMLPLRDGSVDSIITDMPFGKRMGHAKSNNDIYPLALEEFYRVLRPGGTAILLTTEKALVQRCMSKNRWKTHSITAVNFGGMVTSLFCLGKPKTHPRAAALAEQASAGGDG